MVGIAGLNNIIDDAERSAVEDSDRLHAFTEKRGIHHVGVDGSCRQIFETVCDVPLLSLLLNRDVTIASE